MLVFAGGALVFAFLLYRAGVQGLLRDLRSTAWVLAPIVAVWALVYVSNTVAWEQLLRAGTPPSPSGSRGTIPFLQAYAITIASFAINYVTPFVALGGEPFRVASAAPWVGTDRAAASVVSFRATHTLGQVLFWLIAVPVAWILLPHTVATNAVLASVAAVMCVLAAFLVSLFRRGFLIRALAIVHRTPLLRRLGPRIDRVRGTLEHIDGRMAALTSGERQHLIVAVVAEVLGRCIAMLEYFFIARAMGLHIDYATAFVIGAFSQLAINLTVFIPFELGSKEGGLYLIFELLGLPPALGVYASVLSRLRELTWIAIGLTMVWVSGRRASHRSAAA